MSDTPMVDDCVMENGRTVPAEFARELKRRLTAVTADRDSVMALYHTAWDGWRDSMLAHRAVTAERDAAMAALQMLVDAKDMKARLQSLHERGHGTDYMDYERLRAKGWADARTVLRDRRPT